MNFLKWAEQALDSVDSQAASKVADLKKEGIGGASSGAAIASKLFGRDTSTTNNTNTQATNATDQQRLVERSFGSPPSREHDSEIDSPLRSPPRRSQTPDRGSPPVSAVASGASSSPLLSSHRSSPLRSSRTLAGSLSSSSLSSAAGASPVPLPKHGNQPSAKTVGTADEDFLSILNSNTPVTLATSSATTARSPSPASRERSESPSAPANSSTAAAAPAPGASTIAAAAMPRSASGQFITSLLNRVSPGNSPAGSVRKLSAAARGAVSALVDASTAASAVAFSAAAPVDPAGTTVSAGIPSPVAAAPAASSSLSAAAAAHPAPASASSADHAALLAELAESREEVASLKSVWNESRSQVAKLKSILVQKEEAWRARAAQAEEQMKAALDAQAKSHANALDEVRRSNQGSTVELGNSIALLAKTKLEHAREVANLEARVAQLERETIPELTARVASRDAELLAAQERLDAQSALHASQLEGISAAQAAREKRFEDELAAHQSSLSSHHERHSSLEEHNEASVGLIASLQRQLEAANLERDRLQSAQRMQTAREQLEAESVNHLRAQLEGAQRAAATAAAAAKLRQEQMQNQLEALTAENREAHERETQLTNRVAELEAQLPSAVAGSAAAGGGASVSADGVLTPWASPHGSLLDSAAQIAELQDRVRSMAESLLQRTALAERYTAEKTSLRMQLEHESLRVTSLEAQLRTWKAKAIAAEGGSPDDDGADLESGGSGGRRGGGGGMRAGGGKVSPRPAGSLLGSSSSSSAGSYGAEGAHLTGLSSDSVGAKIVGFMDSLGQQLAILLRSVGTAEAEFAGIAYVFAVQFC